jgi:hypothetical protein
MTSLEVGLLQANAHGQDLRVWHLGPASSPSQYCPIKKDFGVREYF